MAGNQVSEHQLEVIRSGVWAKGGSSKWALPPHRDNKNKQNNVWPGVSRQERHRDCDTRPTDGHFCVCQFNSALQSWFPLQFLAPAPDADTSSLPLCLPLLIARHKKNLSLSSQFCAPVSSRPCASLWAHCVTLPLQQAKDHASATGGFQYFGAVEKHYIKISSLTI